MGATVASVFSQASRLIPRRWRFPDRSTAIYLSWTVAWFVIFLMLTFPHDLVVRHWIDRMAADSGWKIHYTNVWLRPWNGYHFSDLRVIPPGKDAEPWLGSARVSLRPSLSALLAGSPFPLGFSGDAYRGTFSGWLNQSRPPAVDLYWSRLDLSDYPRLGRLLEGAWTGEFSGEFHLAPQADAKTFEGRGKIGLRNASLTKGKARGFTIPDLHFATGAAEFEIKGGKVELRSVKLSGSEIDADLHGQLFMPTTNAMPVVNGTLTVKPLPGAPAGLDALLTLLNRNQKPPTGTYTFTLYGALNQLRIR
ncbi:MAG: type II secretion system protein GspN [Candidatus Binatia bacterium]